MNASLGPWRGRRVVVIGDAFLDRWLYGGDCRLCREAPVPAVHVDHVDDMCGGAANTAINLAGLGAQPLLVAPVGLDEPGDRLRACLQSGGVRAKLVPMPGRRTVTKTRILANRHLVARLDEGSTGPLPTAASRVMCDRLSGWMRGAHALVVCDYSAGALTDVLVDWLLARRSRLPLLVVDAHDPLRWSRIHPDLATPSFAELSRLWPARVAGADRVDAVLARADDVRADTGAAITAVTLDVDGSIVVADGVLHRTHTERATSTHTAGAGDVYTAAFTLGLVAGAGITAAADLAQRAATVATTQGSGTCTCRLADLGPPAADGSALVVDGGR